MSAFRFQIFLKDIAVRRFWNVWTRNYLVNTVVKRFKRDRAVREVIQCFKQVILRPRRTFLLSATAVCKGRESFNCDQGITDDELQRLLSDLENLQELAKLTIYCTSCGKRLLIDKKQNGVSYCVCKDSKPAQSSSDGWVPYIEADDVIIWRKEYKPGQGLYAYKVYGRYSDVSASDFAAVQIDGAYRRAWDSAVAALSVVQRGAHGVADQAVLHWEVLWPRLFANRDYVYVRRHKEFDLGGKRPQRDTQPDFESVHAKAKRKSRESYADREAGGNKVYIIVSKSCEHPDVPETKHAIRVTEYWSHMVVKSLNGVDKPGMEFVLTYYDEPAVGGMPGGVAAWASSRAAPVYLSRMRSAAQGYRSWAANRGKEDLPDFTPFGPDQVSYEENSEQISEQDMESSKEGPDLENGVEKRDKGTQTESPDLPVEDEVTLLKVSHSKVDTKEEMADEEQKEETPRETEVDSSGDLKGEATPVREGDSDKAEEDSNSNGSWWRYLLSDKDATYVMHSAILISQRKEVRN